MNCRKSMNYKILKRKSHCNECSGFFIVQNFQDLLTVYK